MTERAERDKAVEAAQTLVDGHICECGHFASEHYFAGRGDGTTWKGCDAHCGCRQFRPVRFRVTRENA